MKKTMKRILCSLLVVVMCLTAAPLQGFVGFDFSVKASAKTIAESGSCGSNVKYEYNRDTKELRIKGNGAMTDYSYYGYCPFYASDVESVIIEDGVTRIGNCAFTSCENLLSISIPDSVTSIGSTAFHGCINLENIILPESIISIGAWAFYGCEKLSEIIMPDELITVERFAFSDCIGLTNVNFNNKLTTIGEYAFDNCVNIKNIYIPDSVSTIEDYTFRGCINVEKIIVGNNNSNFSSDADGVLYNKQLTRIIQYPLGNKRENYIVPVSVSSIGSWAFYRANNLLEINITNNVIDIEEAGFRDCENLKKIIIGQQVTTIDRTAFYGCKNLLEITLCSNLATIGEMAFAWCGKISDVYFCGTEEQWKTIDVEGSNQYLTDATIHYNCKSPQDSYFKVYSDTYSVDSVHRKETATYKINLLDANSNLLPIDIVTVQNNTTDIIAISIKKTSDTELKLTVEPLKDGDASISLFNGDGSLEQFFNFIVYSNTTTYRADQVPVTNEKLKTNFSRGDMTVDNFEYYFDENKGKYIATMDVYNSSGAIGVVSAYTQDGLISDIEQVDPYIPLPGDFGEFLVYLGTGAVSIAKGENWNYRYSGYCQKTSVEIEVPEDGYLTVSCDVTSDNAAFIYNLVSIGVDFAFKTAEVIDVLGTDTDKLAKDTTKTLAKKVSEYFNEDSEWTKGAIKKLAKKLSKQFNMAYLEEISVLSLEMLDEMYMNVGEDFSDVVLDVIIDLTKEEIKEFGVMAAAKKLVKDKVIGTAEKTLLKAASIMFDGGSYVNLVNSILGAYRYNVGTGKTMIVFKPNGEDGFLCKDTIKVTSDIITDEVLLNTYIIKDTQKEDAFVRGRVHPYFNRDDGLDDREISIDLNRVVEIHEISLLKNGEVVSDGFTATVEMNLPSYIDRRTCSIYRVEKDGTYTKLETRIEGNKIIFETDHFSEYILTGVIEDLQETTPCDVHVYDEVRTEPSCTEEGSITYTCYCGDTYTETIEANGHTDSEWIVDKDSTCSAEGSKHIECTVCEEVLKTEAIAKLPHKYSSVVTEATCETGGYTTYTCTCGDTYTADKTPAKGHDYTEGVCKNCGDSKIDNCSCNCHKSGLSGLIWKILRFFYKLFKINPVCICGVSHY